MQRFDQAKSPDIIALLIGLGGAALLKLATSLKAWK